MKNSLVRFFKALGDLRLTLVCLALTMMLVYLGTIAQVHIGTFNAQKAYFNQFLIWGDVAGARLPIFPGGLTVGAVWLVNLVAAFVFHFRYVKNKVGLLISHAGLILLVLGQFLTQTLAHESQMPIEVGHSAQYSESPREMELAFTTSVDADTDEVTRIPQSRFRKPGVIETPQLPFRVHILKYFENAQLGMGASKQSLATQGIGTRVSITEAPPVSTDEEANNVSIFMEPIVGDRSLGVWLVSAGLGMPQSINVNGRDYAFAIRPRRHYYPFRIDLKEFKHDI